MGLSDLGTLDQAQRLPRKNAKPRPRVLDRIAYKRERDLKEREFKAAVWARDKGICQRCGVKVVKTIELHEKRGEVHHLKPRSTSPEKRYDVKHARLFCLKCHTEWHGGVR